MTDWMTRLGDGKVIEEDGLNIARTPAACGNKLFHTSNPVPEGTCAMHSAFQRGIYPFRQRWAIVFAALVFTISGVAAPRIKTFDWTGLPTKHDHEVPADIPKELIDHAVILASDISMRGRYRFHFGTNQQRKPKITIIADKITVPSPVIIERSHRAPIDEKFYRPNRNAIDCDIVARTLHLSETNSERGRLDFCGTRGTNGCSDIRIFFENLVVDKWESNELDTPDGVVGQKPTQEVLSQREAAYKHALETDAPVRVPENDARSWVAAARGTIWTSVNNKLTGDTRRGSLLLLPLSKAQESGVLPEILSAWSSRMLELLEAKASSASLTENRLLAVDVHQKAKAIAKLGWLPTERDQRRFVDAMAAISKLVPAVSLRVVTTRVPGALERTILTFFEKRSSEYRLAPTEALIVPRPKGNDSVLGLLARDPVNEGAVQITFDARLSLDPILLDAASTELKKNGLAAAGMFSNWRLSSPKLNAPGVKRYAIEPQNDRLQVTISLDEDVGTFALWRLESPEGLEVTFAYECNDDSSIKGSIGIPITIARRENPKVKVRDAMVFNEDRGDCRINYFQLDERVVPLDTPLLIKAGGNAKLGIPEGGDPLKVRVPPQAIVMMPKEGLLLEEFQSTLGTAFFDAVEIENLLNAFDETTKLPLDYVEAKVLYSVGGSQPQESPVHKLSPRGADGSRQKISFLRSKSGQPLLRAEGKAVYDRGNTIRAFASETSSDRSIKIVEAMFKDK